MLLWSPKQDVWLNIINPKYKKQIEWTRMNGMKLSKLPLNKLDESIQYVTVKLKMNQVVILPAFWIFDANADVNAIQLDDVLSATMIT
jgi:hypothetical protein